MVFLYTASEAGILRLEVGSAIMADVSYSYTINGGDAVAVDLNSNVDIELEAGDQIVLTVIAEGYSSFKSIWTAE